MDHNINGTKPKTGLAPSPDQDTSAKTGSDETSDKQQLIYLPAIEAKEPKPAPSPLPIENKTTPPDMPKKKDEPEAAVNNAPETLPEYLPEYQAPTNGLRALLSTFDPDDLASHNANSSQKPDFEARIEASLVEDDLPPASPALTGSPDLPAAPTRWGLYLSGMVGSLVLLFVLALSYAHMSSPTGIDWAKARSGTARMWHKLANSWSRDKALTPQSTRTAEFSLPEPLQIDPQSGEPLNTTTSRISTTAATPKKGSIATPSDSEIFLSQKELEEQILSLEAKQAGLTRHAPRAVNTDIRAANKKIARSLSRDFDQLVVIPSTRINPDMESKFFRRAKSYLQQHDISSARMILQYAASQGSGLSAMALAETYDPNFAQRINLPNGNTSRSDARKWYTMASRLGIKSAKARLKALR